MLEREGSGAQIVLSGESAGGNLALALLIAGKQRGLAMPSAAALFSPRRYPMTSTTGAWIMTSSHFSTYIERNAQFAATDAKDHVPEIPFIPSKQLYLITCIDPRVEPAATVGSELGEAIVARNVGGRITPSVIKDLLWILHLHENLTPDADWFEIAVIHHTECGSALFARDELRAGYVARDGWDDKTALDMAVVDPAKTVAEDVQKLRSAPALQPTIGNVKIGGYVYDLKTGTITTVVEPG